MTFCLGMKSESGLLAIADTHITSGSEVSFAKKVSVHQGAAHSLFIMTSGLRSARDKALTYFDERLETAETGLTRLNRVANALAEEIRRVSTEDQEWLARSGLSFDLHAILGGQMADDAEPHMFLIYPEGNWIEVTGNTPYVIIGKSSYGKPLLDRAWRFEGSLDDAHDRSPRVRFNARERGGCGATARHCPLCEGQLCHARASILCERTRPPLTSLVGVDREGRDGSEHLLGAAVRASAVGNHRAHLPLTPRAMPRGVPPVSRPTSVDTLTRLRAPPAPTT